MIKEKDEAGFNPKRFENNFQNERIHRENNCKRRILNSDGTKVKSLI